MDNQDRSLFFAVQTASCHLRPYSATSNGVSWPDHIFYSFPKAFLIVWLFQLRWHCWQIPSPTQQPKPGTCAFTPWGQGKAFHFRSFLATLTSLLPLREKDQGKQQSTKPTHNTIYCGRHFLYLVHLRRLWTCVDFAQSISLHNQEMWCLGMLPETRKESSSAFQNRTLLEPAAQTSFYSFHTYITVKHCAFSYSKTRQVNYKGTLRPQIHCISFVCDHWLLQDFCSSWTAKQQTATFLFTKWTNEHQKKKSD